MRKDDRDAAGDDRRARLAEQLRANLRRRKAQSRARAAASPESRPGFDETGPDDSGSDTDTG